MKRWHLAELSSGYGAELLGRLLFDLRGVHLCFLQPLVAGDVQLAAGAAKRDGFLMFFVSAELAELELGFKNGFCIQGLICCRISCQTHTLTTRLENWWFPEMGVATGTSKSCEIRSFYC